MHVTIDTGAWLRNILGTLLLCSVPAERKWQNTDIPGAEPNGFNREPTAFVYPVADNFVALKFHKIFIFFIINEILIKLG
jgi:C1A family cysteine protease